MMISMSRKSLLFGFAIVFLLFVLGGTSNVSSVGLPSTTPYNFFGVEFEYPFQWNASETSDNTTLYLYPQDGIVMLQFHDDLSIESSLSRKTLMNSIIESGDDIQIGTEAVIESSGSMQDGFIYDYKQTVDDEVYAGKFVIFDHDTGFMAIVLATSESSNLNHMAAYRSLVESMGFEVSRDTFAESSTSSGNADFIFETSSAVYEFVEARVTTDGFIAFYIDYTNTSDKDHTLWTDVDFNFEFEQAVGTRILPLEPDFPYVEETYDNRPVLDRYTNAAAGESLSLILFVPLDSMTAPVTVRHTTALGGERTLTYTIEQ